MDKKVSSTEWIIIFIVLSSIVAVLFIGEFKRRVVKNQIIYIKQKDFIVEKSPFLVFFPPMNRLIALVK